MMDSSCLVDRAGARRFSVAMVVLALVSCGGPGLTTPSAVECTAPIDVAGRKILEFDAGVGRDAAGTCAGIGGTPVFVTANGVLYTRSTWTDPRARLRTQVFRDSFNHLVASGVQEGAAQCVSASLRVFPGEYIVRTCHAPDSRVPLAVREDASTFTQHRLTIVYP
jgi:hypothetical protein